MENKRPGACVQNLPGVVPYLAVATRAVARPPAHAVSVHPGRCCARIRSGTSPSTCAPGFSPRSRSVSTANPNPNTTASVLELRRAIAGAPSSHCQIAATRSCASTSSPSSPSRASWGAAVSSPSSIYRTPVVEPRRRNTSPSSPLRPLRPP